MKTIVVPTDFSKHALFALKAATCIARKVNAKIIIVHVYNLPSSGLELSNYLDKYYSEVKQRAHDQMERLAASNFLDGVEVENLILSDTLMWQIATLEQFQNIDLIVIGSHGESGYNRIFIGSNTEKIVRLANVPVLTIKEESEDFEINKMVFASNFNEESYDAFEKIRSFAEIYKSHIVLLKIITAKEFETSRQSEELLEAFINRFQLENYSVQVINAQSIEQGIVDFSNQIDADLIAIETHGRTGIAHLILGSLTENIVKHESRPVLSIKMSHRSEYDEKLLHLSKNFENWGAE